MNSPVGVITAIRSIIKDIGEHGVAKGQKNKEQGYQYRGIDDMLNALSPLYAKHGLVIVPKVVSRDVIQSTTKSGSALWKVSVCVEYHLHAEDGSTLVASTYGEAMDSADKATNKALSAAYKYLVIQLFAIPVVGTPDADATTPEEQVPVLNETQLKKVRDMVEARGVDEITLLEWISGKAGYEIKTLEAIPQTAFAAVIRSLTPKEQQT